MAGNPVSPHLQVYRPQLTSVLSIMHRATGVFLSVGTLLLLYWLFAASQGADSYATAQACMSAGLSQIVMVAWTFSLYFHLSNGIRHLLWDIGWGFELTTAYRTGYLVIASSLVLTALTWACVLTQGSGT